MKQKIFSISELNAQSRLVLESHFRMIWLEGEIANLTCHRSGHWYFSLKDKLASVRCAMFRGQNARLPFQPENGMHILAYAKVSLYEERGEFQLILESMEPIGTGSLQAEFEALKAALQAKGYFDLARKKPLPQLPSCIGLITSPQGAALRDMLIVLKRRFPAIPLLIYPCDVQGKKAAPEIAGQIWRANHDQDCDLLIIARGGGSLEDLFAFNELIVAEALYASTIPTLTGIGHEIDTTIADWVADCRAPTPSAAAELAVPLQSHYMEEYNTIRSKLEQIVFRKIEKDRITLSHLLKQLDQMAPHKQIARLQTEFKQQALRLQEAQRRYFRHLQEKLSNLCQILHQLSPLATLDRGYALIFDQNQKIISSKTGLKTGDPIQITFKDGQIQAIVKK